ncbi:MAG: hypothetical protein M1816_003283 [Peltula sp. TS41687]|nr:MAG: hypothetical protein M1816_003283 [Peltula sp. TS41687]
MSPTAFEFLINRMEITPAFRKSSVTLVFDLLDESLKHKAQRRLQESAKVTNCMKGSNVVTDPFLVHVIYLQIALERWINTLRVFNNQLIDHGKALQHEDDTAEEISAISLTERNRVLHSMAAHLHRYTAELHFIGDTVSEILARAPLFTVPTKSAAACAGTVVPAMNLSVEFGLREV